MVRRREDDFAGNGVKLKARKTLSAGMVIAMIVHMEKRGELYVVTDSNRGLHARVVASSYTENAVQVCNASGRIEVLLEGHERYDSAA